MEKIDIKTDIERFVLEELLSGSRTQIDPEEPLFSGGTLDSLGTLRLITFLEEKYNLQIGDGEVGDENFGTIARLQAFISRKLAEANPA
jgi:acyl carrier protein